MHKDQERPSVLQKCSVALQAALARGSCFTTYMAFSREQQFFFFNLCKNKSHEDLITNLCLQNKTKHHKKKIVIFFLFSFKQLITWIQVVSVNDSAAVCIVKGFTLHWTDSSSRVSACSGLLKLSARNHEDMHNTNSTCDKLSWWVFIWTFFFFYTLSGLLHSVRRRFVHSLKGVRCVPRFFSRLSSVEALQPATSTQSSCILHKRPVLYY